MEVRQKPRKRYCAIQISQQLPLTRPMRVVYPDTVSVPVRRSSCLALHDLMTPLILRWHRTCVRTGAGLRASG